jgi:hypothetical protein
MAPPDSDPNYIPPTAAAMGNSGAPVPVQVLPMTQTAPASGTGGLY